jgi:hypothetical protein
MADTIHASNGQSLDANPIQRAVQRTADTLSAASEYLRTNDAETILEDAGSWLRRHPAEAIAGALVLGVFAGRFLFRDKPSPDR